MRNELKVVVGRGQRECHRGMERGAGSRYHVRKRLLKAQTWVSGDFHSGQDVGRWILVGGSEVAVAGDQAGWWPVERRGLVLGDVIEGGLELLLVVGRLLGGIVALIELMRCVDWVDRTQGRRLARRFVLDAVGLSRRRDSRDTATGLRVERRN